MLTELKKLAGDFASQPLTRGREMRELLENSPDDFCTAAVEVLSGDDAERVKRYLVALLWTNNLLIRCLTDPSTPVQKAESIAALARRVDPQLPAKLVGFVLEGTDVESPECLERVLGLLKSMPDAVTFRPLLTPLLRHPDARIRSKVALIAGEGNRNRTWFERRMQEDDPRVRANAIESAGPAVAEGIRPLLRTAIADSNNRVAGNALLTLYRMGEAEAIAGLYELVGRPEPAFRATAVWAMGETGDTRFLPLLARILADPNATIKAATFLAIRKLRGQENKAATPVELRILGEPFFSGPELKLFFGATEDSKPVRGLIATAVRILVNGEPVYRYSVTEQDSRRRISAAFLVRQTANMEWEQAAAYRDALERCFQSRHSGDGWTLARHCGSRGPAAASRPETLFGVRIDTSDSGGAGCSLRAISNPGDLRFSFESRELIRCQDFTTTFFAVCQELRASRLGAHLFLLDPETAKGTDPALLARAAREAHVAVHAICSSPDAGIREICQATGGFYGVGDNTPERVASLYQGITHRYQVSLTTEATVQRVQVSVRDAKFSGDSPVLEMAG
jgi:hypothetical protein